jgi:hypothetical protein
VYTITIARGLSNLANESLKSSSKTHSARLVRPSKIFVIVRLKSFWVHKLHRFQDSKQMAILFLLDMADNEVGGPYRKHRSRMKSLVAN